MSVIPQNLLVPCTMKRIICHWSEGNYIANSTDREAYNLLVEGDGTVRGGDHPISDNVSTADGDYAAHTLHCNTGSIGIACCCMMGCREKPFQAGARPMKKVQWDAMVQAVAELCAFYGIAVTPTTVLGHGEVQKNLGIVQRGKWDPMVWPWDTGVSREDVGKALREQVKKALADMANPSRAPVMLEIAAANGTAAAAVDSPCPEAYTLRSTLLAGDPVMRDIAATNRVLIPPLSSQRIDGVATLQEALNRVALQNPSVPRIAFGPCDKFRGFFGPQTVKAVRAFQAATGVGIDGMVGDDTLKVLDAALAGAEIADVAGTDGLAAIAVTSLQTFAVDGYVVPEASRKALEGARFDTAKKIGGKYVEKFAKADATVAKKDPSRCKVLLRFDNDAVYFDAKMAVCVDGSPRATQLDPHGQLGTAHQIGGKPIDAEKISYVVLPQPDKSTSDNFLVDLGLKKGDLAVVICDGVACGAILGELGPAYKIGETSIRLHERLHTAGTQVKNPWKNSGKTAIQNVSVRQDVLYLIFPNTASLIASKLTPANAEKLIQTTAEELFAKFRGA